MTRRLSSLAGVALCASTLLCAVTVSAQTSQDSRTRLEQRVPPAITDTEFWRIITSYSEAGGNFPSDNFTSNELSIGQIALQLRNRQRSGGAYVGVGPEQNFTYIANLDPEIAFIVDIRRQAIMQHLMYKAVFELSADRSQFVARLFSIPLQKDIARTATAWELWQAYGAHTADSAQFKANLADIMRHLTVTRGFRLSTDDSISVSYIYSAFFQLGPTISYSGFAQSPKMLAPANFMSLTLVRDDSGGTRTFLASDDNYQRVRSLQMRNRIIPVVGDFGGDSALRKIARHLHATGTTLTAFYVSNVEQYLFRSNESWRAFYASVAQMPFDTASIFIRPSLSTPRAQSIYFSYAPQRPAGAPAANAGTGSVSGNVGNSSPGNPASIQINGTALTAVTDSLGHYEIPNVPPGVYTITMRSISAADVVIPHIKVTAGQSSVVNIHTATSTMPGAYTSGVPYSAIVGNPVFPLCPIAAFLHAHAAGRIVNYGNVLSCTR